ncbi:Hypothetical_protein [Hexamita inflata]|uniref:Hypothetical_protein n=1 Tax=Hexamita inflata TaxID=28002 RepID=A0AA86URQ3_9EUKA|nr:Hypothetical protein HINF_LOCUS49877 [Hexamita inflata]
MEEQRQPRKVYSESENDEFVKAVTDRFFDANPHISRSSLTKDGELDKYKFFGMYVKMYGWRINIFDSKKDVKRFRDIITRFYRSHLMFYTVEQAVRGLDLNIILKKVWSESQDIMDSRDQAILMQICKQYGQEVAAQLVQKQDPNMVLLLMYHKIRLQRHFIPASGEGCIMLQHVRQNYKYYQQPDGQSPLLKKDAFSQTVPKQKLKIETPMRNEGESVYNEASDSLNAKMMLEFQKIFSDENDKDDDIIMKLAEMKLKIEIKNEQ